MTDDKRRAVLDHLDRKMNAAPEHDPTHSDYWTEERWAEYRAEADAYFEALDYGYPANGAPDRPAPLPAARVVRRGLRAWVADMCRRTRNTGA